MSCHNFLRFECNEDEDGAEDDEDKDEHSSISFSLAPKVIGTIT